MKIQITGMKCEGCVENIKEGLEKVEGVEEAQVTLDPPEAYVKCDRNRVKDTRVLEVIDQLGFGGEIMPQE